MYYCTRHYYLYIIIVPLASANSKRTDLFNTLLLFMSNMNVKQCLLYKLYCEKKHVLDVVYKEIELRLSTVQLLNYRSSASGDIE